MELDWFIRSIAAELVVTLIGAAAVYIFRSKIRLHFERAFHYLFDTKVRVDLSRVDRYSVAPKSELDMELFQALKKGIGDASFKSLSDNKLCISVSEIPTPIEVKLEEEPSFGTPHRKESRYEVRIETQTPMTFGFRSDKCLREFERVSEEISSHLSMRFDQEAKTSFVTGTVYGQAPLAEEEIKDETLGMRAKVRDASLELRFEDPRRMTQGIRKYFRPLD